MIFLIQRHENMINYQKGAMDDEIRATSELDISDVCYISQVWTCFIFHLENLILFI